MRDVGRSTDPVFTKRTWKESPTPFTKQGKTTMRILKLNPLATIEAHYMEKIPGMFFTKNLTSSRLKKERHDLYDMEVSKLSGNFHSGSELLL